MAVFRTLNREAIAAKLAASANTPANGYQADSNALPHVPCSIQLVKIGHQKPTSLAAAAAGAKQGSSNSLLSGSNEQYGVNFSLEQDIPLANLAARLEEEQAEVRAQSQSDSSCPAVRWIDVCGFDPNVLNLLSNLYELPHEMLGDEIELETAPHADFYAGSASAAISGGGGDVLRPTKLSSRSSSTAEKKDEDESTQTIPPEGGHPTFKLLIHSLQLINYPLHRDSDGRLTLVSRAHYMKNKPVLQTVPVHVVIANEHTLITCRPWIDPVSASQSSGSVYSAAAAAMNRALTAARLSSGTNDLASADEEDPNQMFADLIETLSETDSTLMGSALGLTTAKQLMLRVVEDVTERNWAIRDEFKGQRANNEKPAHAPVELVCPDPPRAAVDSSRFRSVLCCWLAWRSLCVLQCLRVEDLHGRPRRRPQRHLLSVASARHGIRCQSHAARAQTPGDHDGIAVRPRRRGWPTHARQARAPQPLLDARPARSFHSMQRVPLLREPPASSAASRPESPVGTSDSDGALDYRPAGKLCPTWPRPGQ